MAIAGNPAIATEMARTLRTSFDFYRRSQLQPMSLPAKMRALARLLHDNLPATLQGFGMVAPFSPASTEPPAIARRSISTIRSARNSRPPLSPAPARRSGSIKSVLHFLEQWGDPKARSRCRSGRRSSLANQLLMTAAEFDTATGGVDPGMGEFATIKLLSARRHPSDLAEEQAAFWREVRKP